MKHILTIEVDLIDLERDERVELQSYLDGSIDPDDEDEGLPRAEDVYGSEIFDAIEMAVESSDDLWAGSGNYCRIASLKLLRAEVQK